MCAAKWSTSKFLICIGSIEGMKYCVTVHFYCRHMSVSFEYTNPPLGDSSGILHQIYIMICTTSHLYDNKYVCTYVCPSVTVYIDRQLSLEERDLKWVLLSQPRESKLGTRGKQNWNREYQQMTFLTMKKVMSRDITKIDFHNIFPRWKLTILSYCTGNTVARSIAMLLFSLLVMTIGDNFLLLPKLVMAIREAVQFLLLTWPVSIY